MVPPSFDLWMVTLKDLFKNKPVVMYELAMLCRNPNHEPFGSCGKDLIASGLVVCEAGKWQVDQPIQNIVLSAFRGEEVQDMVFGSPVK